MERRISRRSFLKTSAVALGSVAVCDFGSAVQVSG
ncbi:MAG: twin-arginine translocation signal domain-containing protein [Syntrophales bacterium]